MKPLTTLGYLQLAFLAKPACDRKIYRLIKQHQLQSILEIGLGNGQRCQEMLRVASKYSDKPIRYTGIDLFDAREAEKPLKLIEMHKALKSHDAKTQLVPGDAQSAIERIANSHLRTDLIVISSSTPIAEIESAISFLPRMLHANSMVLLQSAADEPFKTLNRLDIERWSANSQKKSQPTSIAKKAA